MLYPHVELNFETHTHDIYSHRLRLNAMKIRNIKWENKKSTGVVRKSSKIANKSVFLGSTVSYVRFK